LIQEGCCIENQMSFCHCWEHTRPV